ncbi:MAG: hypothetical protein MJ081_00555 [Ruminococcus sp.]|nr:hypothetical protein [Ruminococcus sp.]
MKICENCGRVLQDSEKCTCSENTQNTDNSALSEDNALKPIIAIAVVFAVFLIIFSSLVSGSGYKGTVEKFFESRYSKHGGKNYYSLILPDDTVKQLKKDDKWDSLVKNYNDGIKHRMEDWDKKPKFRKITEKRRLKNSELTKAEQYFCEAAEFCGADTDGYSITKGYSVTYKYKDTEGDIEETTIYAVRIKGDGWKIMNDIGTAFYGLG